MALCSKKFKFKRITTLLYFVFACFCIVWLNGPSETAVCQPVDLDQQLYRDILANYTRYVQKAPTIKNSTRLVVLVLLREDDLFSRSEISKTWGHPSTSRTVSDGSTQIIFLFGRSGSLVTDVRYDSINILQVDIPEIYQNMILKELVAYKWLLENFKNGHVLKIDGKDTVAHLDRLRAQIPSESSDGIFCLTWKEVAPIRDPCSKWNVPMEHFSAPHFSEYCTGPAYLMDIGSMRRIISAARSHKALVVEDAYFTGVLADSAGVPRHYSPSIFSIQCKSSTTTSLIASIFEGKYKLKNHVIFSDRNGAKTTSVLAGHSCEDIGIRDMWRLLQ